MKANSWWRRATREQRLVQVKAGIELGMTAKQIGMNCGASAQTVAKLGNSAGLSFRGDFSLARLKANQRTARKNNSRFKPRAEFEHFDSFSIFEAA